VHGLIAAEASGGWTLGGSIWTFAFPMALFIVVAGVLFFVYTRPHTVPGLRAVGPARPVAPHPPKAEPAGGEAKSAETGADSDAAKESPAEGTEAAE